MGTFSRSSSVAYYNQKTHDKEVAEDTYQLAQELERSEKEGGKNRTYVKDEDISFLYRVASNLDPTHVRAKELLCLKEAEILLDNIVLREGRPYGVDEIYILDSLKK